MLQRAVLVAAAGAALLLPCACGSRKRDAFPFEMERAQRRRCASVKSQARVLEFATRRNASTHGVVTTVVGGGWGNELNCIAHGVLVAIATNRTLCVNRSTSRVLRFVAPPLGFVGWRDSPDCARYVASASAVVECGGTPDETRACLFETHPATTLLAITKPMNWLPQSRTEINLMLRDKLGFPVSSSSSSSSSSSDHEHNDPNKGDVDAARSSENAFQAFLGCAMAQLIQPGPRLRAAMLPYLAAFRAAFAAVAVHLRGSDAAMARHQLGQQGVASLERAYLAHKKLIKHERRRRKELLATAGRVDLGADAAEPPSPGGPERGNVEEGQAAAAAAGGDVGEKASPARRQLYDAEAGRRPHRNESSSSEFAQDVSDEDVSDEDVSDEDVSDEDVSDEDASSRRRLSIDLSSHGRLGCVHGAETVQRRLEANELHSCLLAGEHDARNATRRRSLIARSDKHLVYFVAGDHDVEHSSWLSPGALGLGVTVLTTPGHPLHSGRRVNNASLARADVRTELLKTLLDFFLLAEADFFVSNCRYDECYAAGQPGGKKCGNSFAYHVHLRRTPAAANLESSFFAPADFDCARIHRRADQRYVARAQQLAAAARTAGAAAPVASSSASSASASASAASSVVMSSMRTVPGTILASRTISTKVVAVTARTTTTTTTSTKTSSVSASGAPDAEKTPKPAASSSAHADNTSSTVHPDTSAHTLRR